MNNKLGLFVRIIITVTALFFLCAFSLSLLQGIVNLGSIAGTALCLWILSMSIVPIHRALMVIFFKFNITKFIYYTINTCFVIFTIYGTIISGIMVYYACQAPSENATAVVLGAQVQESGPSVILSGRINAAEKYLKKNTKASAVLSGGQGDDEPMSEAEAIYNKLNNKGISSNRLYLESKSTNTTENLEYSLKIIKDYKLNDDIAVVTDGFHQLRVNIIASQLDLKQNVGAVNSDTSFIYLPTFVVREWFAIPYQLIRPLQ